MKTIGKVIGIIVLCCVLLVLGTCYFRNCTDDKPPKIDIPDAKYKISLFMIVDGELQVRAIYYSDKVQVFGSGSTELVYMYGYWENIKGKYVFKDITLKLDERIFGEIEVKKIGN